MSNIQKGDPAKQMIPFEKFIAQPTIKIECIDSELSTYLKKRYILKINDGQLTIKRSHNEIQALFDTLVECQPELQNQLPAIPSKMDVFVGSSKKINAINQFFSTGIALMHLISESSKKKMQTIYYNFIYNMNEEQQLHFSQQDIVAQTNKPYQQKQVNEERAYFRKQSEQSQSTIESQIQQTDILKGYCLGRFSSGKWQKWYFRLKKDFIQITESEQHSQDEIIYPISYSRVNLDLYGGVIQIQHHFDLKSLELSCDAELYAEESQMHQQLKSWGTILKQQVKLVSESEKAKACGKLLIEINSIKLETILKHAEKVVQEETKMEQQEPNSDYYEYYLKIWHQGFSARLSLKQSQVGRKQIFLPLMDKYGVFAVEVVRELKKNWSFLHKKTLVISDYEINIGDVLQDLSGESKSRCYEVDLRSKYKALFSKENKGTISLTITDFSDYWSVFSSFNPNQFENKTISPDVYDRMQMKIIVNRCKRLLYLFSLRMYQVADLFNFKYPTIGYLCYAVLALIVFLINLNQICFYVSATFLLIMILAHPSVGTQIFTNLQNSLPLKINDHYVKPRVQQKKQHDFVKFLTKFKFSTAVLEDNVIVRFNKLKKYQSNTHFIEKIKNLLYWDNRYNSLILFIALILLSFFTFFLHFRTVFILLVIRTCLKKRNFYKEKNEHNRKVATTVIKFIVDNHFPDLKQVQLQPKEKFASNQQALRTQFMDYLIEFSNENLSIIIDKDTLYLSENVHQIIGLLASSSDRLYVKKSIQDKAKSDLPVFVFKPISALEILGCLVINFLYSTPSDSYKSIVVDNSCLRKE